LIEAEIGPEQFGLAVRYSYDAPELDGTLGAIRRAQHLLGDRFLVLYGDTHLTVDHQSVVDHWKRSGKPGVMTVLHNEGRWGPSNTVVEGGLVVGHSKRVQMQSMEWIDYGLGGLVSTALDLVDEHVTDLSDLYGDLASRGMLCAFEVSERFYEIGTPEQLLETDAYLSSLIGRDPPA